MDNINHPSYYADGKIEVIEFIEDKNFGYCLGNAVKYISRSGKKSKETEIQDLQKAIWYINRRIQELSEQQETVNGEIPENSNHKVSSSDDIREILSMVHEIGKSENTHPYYKNSKYLHGWDDAVSACEDIIEEVTGMTYGDCCIKPCRKGRSQ